MSSFRRMNGVEGPSSGVWGSSIKGKLWMSLALVWVLAASAASAQTQAIFANGITAPGGGMILSGAGTNPATGNNYHHLWTGDQGGLGLCRIDPDVASPGPHTVNSSTCLSSIAGIQFKPGQFAYDPLFNNIYAVDRQASTQGIFRLHFIPSGDGGHGAVDPINVEVLGGNGIGRNGLTGCGIAGNGPSSVALGPDGNLYIGFSQTGETLRVQSPQTEPLPCANVQVIGTTADNFEDRGLGWIGHDLFGGDGQSAWVIRNADQCMTPANGNAPCTATSFLSSQTAVPSLVFTDQVYPATNGTKLFIGNPRDITLVDATSLQVTPAYAVGFLTLEAMALDAGQQTLYAADDLSAGLQPQQGRWWHVVPPQVTAAIPSVPFNVLAIAGAGSVTVQWSTAPAQNITSYTVRNTFASVGAPIPDVVVAPAAGSLAPPTQVTIDGLTNGGVYQFIVAATNSAGTSRFSFPSNLVSPRVPTVPKAPTHVVAAGHDSSADVVWVGTPDYLNGGFPIAVYTVDVQVEGQNSGITVTVPATTTRTTITGLTNGLAYRFTVRASNQLGDSVPSLPSNIVIPTASQPAQAPREPRNVTAVAGNASATVSWLPPVSDGGSPVLTYIVVPVTTAAQKPGLTTVPALATSAVITGLSNGTAYSFIVHAVNAMGDSGPSNPSNAVTPSAAQPAQGSVPAVPTNVSASAGDASAFVTWTPPASNGGQSITSYNVVALIAGIPNGITATVPASVTGTAVNGLNNGVTYTFVVHALNAVGDSGPSLPSSPVTPAIPPAAAANLNVSLSGPTTVTPATNAVFTLAVTNTGSAAAPHVTVTHAFTANSATYVANTTSQGTCSSSANMLTCRLGSMAAGASATVIITLKITSSLASRAFVQASDANGVVVPASPAGAIGRLRTMVSSSPAPAAAAANQLPVSTSGSGLIPAPASSGLTGGTPPGVAAAGGATAANAAPAGDNQAAVPVSCSANADGTSGPTATPNSKPRICAGP